MLSPLTKIVKLISGFPRPFESLRQTPGHSFVVCQRGDVYDDVLALHRAAPAMHSAFGLQQRCNLRPARFIQGAAAPRMAGCLA